MKIFFIQNKNHSPILYMRDCLSALPFFDEQSFVECNVLPDRTGPKFAKMRTKM